MQQPLEKVDSRDVALSLPLRVAFQSEGLIEECDVHGNAQTQIVVQGGSKCVFRRCHVREGKSDGIVVRGKSRGTFEDCRIYDNVASGIEIQGESNPTLRGCEIHGNGGTGILVKEKSAGTIELCDIDSNGERGLTAKLQEALGMTPSIKEPQIEVREESAPFLRQCKISGAKGIGISIQSKAMGLLEDCDVAGSEGVGIWVGGESAPKVRRCVVRDGHVNGIVIGGQAKGVFEECEVAAHHKEYPAVVIRDGSDPLLSGCRIHNCASHGLWIRARSSGTILNCEIFDTTSAGVSIDEESAPALKSCVVCNSKSTGISVLQKSTADVEACQIRANAFAGVTVHDGADAKVDECVISENGHTAIWIKENGTATVSACDLSGNKRGAWDIAPGCLVRRRGNHAEGQRFLTTMCPLCGEEFEFDAAGLVACPDPECLCEFTIDEDGDLVDDEDGAGVVGDDCGEEHEGQEKSDGPAAAESNAESPVNPLAESDRRAVFVSLMTTSKLDHDIHIARRKVEDLFGLRKDQLQAIEAEGYSKSWPPLDSNNGRSDVRQA